MGGPAAHVNCPTGVVLVAAGRVRRHFCLAAAPVSLAERRCLVVSLRDSRRPRLFGADCTFHKAGEYRHTRPYWPGAPTSRTRHSAWHLLFPADFPGLYGRQLRQQHAGLRVMGSTKESLSAWRADSATLGSDIQPGCVVAYLSGNRGNYLPRLRVASHSGTLGAYLARGAVCGFLLEFATLRSALPP